MRRGKLPFTFVIVAALAGTGAACSSSSDTPSAGSGPLALRPVAWAASEAGIGKVQAVAESPEGVVVVSDKGALTLVGGVIAASNAQVATWKGVATIDAVTGSGAWTLGVDASGAVQRIRPDGALEDVSDRFGLGGEAVSSIAAFGKGNVGFTLPGALALADGATVRRFDIDLAWVAGNGTRFAGLSSGKLIAFDGAMTSLVTYPLDGVSAAAFSDSGKLVVLAGRALYVEDDGGTLRTRATFEADPHGLVVSASHVWIGVGTELAALDGTAAPVRISKGAGLSTSATLAASASGDVWVVSDGTLRRYSLTGASVTTTESFDATLKPIFDRVCSQCHTPGGSASIDLSTAAAWDARRAAVYDRVVVKQTMPPAGSAQSLTDDERAAIKAWAIGK